MATPFTLSAVELAQKIAQQEITAETVMEALIAHIKVVNPQLNALCNHRFSEALAEARVADKRVQMEGTSSLPPLLGVPFTVKEVFSVKGLPHTGASLTRQQIIASEDASVVANLRKTGAIPIATTNTPEFAMWSESFNKLYGRTNNPYHFKHTVGGSSGGEGAIISTGGVPFGIGTDAGGSIRLPALFNGIFGHKPTGGVISQNGMLPPIPPKINYFCGIGPLSRTAKDLWPLLMAMLDKKAEDWKGREILIQDPESIQLKNLKVYDLFQTPLLGVQQSIKSKGKEVSTFLKTQGAAVQKWEIPHFRFMFQIWSSRARYEPNVKMMNWLSPQGLWEWLKEAFLWAIRKSEYTFPIILYGLLDHISIPFLRWFQIMGDQMEQKVLATLGNNGVILMPTYHTSAPRHYMTGGPMWKAGFNLFANVLGLPATHVPLGIGENGLPIGIQIVSAPGNDYLTIAVAIALENHFENWVPPWKVNENLLAPDTLT